jgi:hypothetical protein
MAFFVHDGDFNPRLISPARGLGAGTNVAANATEKNHVVLLQVRT